MDAEYKHIDNNINNNVQQWKIICRQILINSTSSTFSIMSGISMGAPTVIIPQLRKEAIFAGAISNEMVSWTSSASSFASLVWVLVITILAFRSGRKITMLVVDVCIFLACLNLYFSKSITQILISQVLLGVADASLITLSTIIGTEYSSPKYRGIFLTFKAANSFWGIWISNILGTYFHWTTIGITGMAITIYNFFIILMIPESPYWLASKERYDECATSHRWIKGVNDDAEKELNVIILNQKANRIGQRPKQTFCIYVWQHINILRLPEIYKPILCCLLISLVYIWSGKMACMVYAIDMIKSITNSERTAYAGMLVLDGFTVLGMYLASGLNIVMKRRTLLLSGTSVCIFFLFVLSIYLFSVKLSFFSENKYISLALLIGYSLGACCGPMIMAMVILSELIPVEHRSVSLVVVSMCVKMFVGTLLKVSPYVFRGFGFHGTFLFFGIGCSIALYLNYKYLPETKNKTLYEIAECFKPKTSVEAKELVNLNENDK